MKKKRRLTPLQVLLPAIQIHPGKGHFLRKECCWRQYGKAFLVKESFPVRGQACLTRLGHVMACFTLSLSLSGLGILLSQRTMAQNSPILCPFFLQFPAGGFLSAYHLLPCTARYNTNISWWCWILLLLLLLGVALAACFSECIAGWLGT